MDSSHVDRHRIGLIPLALATLLSAALLYVGTGLQPLPWLVLIAPIPLLFAGYRAATWQALLASLLCWLLAGGNLVPYLRDTLSLPWPVIGLALFNPAWHFALAFWISRKLRAKGRPILAVLALPMLWASLNYLDAQVSPHGSFGNLAYSQIDNLILKQSLAVTGLWGLDCLLMLVPNALALACLPRLAPGLRLRWLALGLLPLLSAGGYGLLRLQAHIAPDGQSLRVAALAYDAPAYPLPLADPATTTLLTEMDVDVARLAARGAHYVLLPETILRLSESDRQGLLARWQTLADTHQITLVIGVAEPIGPDQGERNAAWLIRPQQSHAVYAKQHLLPIFEDRYRPGSLPMVFDGADGRFGIAICKDLDFPALGRDYGLAGVQLLLVPAWDFDQDGRLHAQMAEFRGIENGYAVLRSARRGVLSLSDHLGRQRAFAASSERSIVAELELAPASGTIYRRFGNWFAYVALAVSVLCLLLAFAGPAADRHRRTVPLSRRDRA